MPLHHLPPQRVGSQACRTVVHMMKDPRLALPTQRADGVGADQLIECICAKSLHHNCWGT
eukprot:4341970-Prymnesium_polylepis.1